MGLEALTKEGWLSILEKIGFTDITTRVRSMNQWKQILGDLELQSMDFFKIWGRFFYLLSDRKYRGAVHHFAKEALRIPHGFTRYYGYGLYVGQK
jgi:hypothetical protein